MEGIGMVGVFETGEGFNNEKPIHISLNIENII